MSTILCVNNLPTHTSGADLQALFAQAGKVQKVKIIPLHPLPGIGFVQMASAKAALKARALLDGTKFRRLQLVVQEAPVGLILGPGLRYVATFEGIGKKDGRRGPPVPGRGPHGPGDGP